MRLLQKITPKRPLYAQVLFTAIAFMAMAVLSYVFMSTIVHDHLVGNTEAVLTFQRASLETSLEEFKTPMELTAMEVRGMILRGEGAESIRAFFINLSGQFMSNEKHRLSVNGLVGYFETLPDGPAFITSFEHQPETIRLTGHPWYGAAIRAGKNIAETVMYDDMFTGEAIFVYSRCIFDDEGNRLGVVGLRMVISAMAREVIETALAQGGYGMLLSRDLVMIAHPNPDFVGRQLFDLDSNLARFTDDLKRGLDVSERPVVTFRNEDAVAFFRRLSNGWYLGLVTPNKTYYQSVRLMMILLSILGVTFASVLSLILISIDRARKKSDTESKHKSVFLANMSHEIRTPMNAIIGMTSIGKTATDMERKDYCFTKIEDASNHLLGVINDILDVSKIEANRLELSPVEFNFEKMLQQVVNVINFRVDEKQQKFMVHMDRVIPQTLVGDDQRLAQVITNLLSNAVKFTPEKGSIDLSIRFIGEENGFCSLQIAVTDTGIGISPEQQIKLFQSFQQAEAGTTRKFGGTGLGLTISKNIVEMMGGRIWIESEIGKGATFTFIVQLKRGAEKLEADREEIKEDAQTDINGLFAKHRVLLVEDVEINREIVLALLEPTLLKIDCAENGAEAVRMFNHSPDKYNMIFMDLQMPEMDGYEATRSIRLMEEKLSSAETNNTPRRIPIIAMTANVFKEDVEKCLQSGMDGHVGKPLDFEEVVKKLRLYLK